MFQRVQIKLEIIDLARRHLHRHVQGSTLKFISRTSALRSNHPETMSSHVLRRGNVLHDQCSWFRLHCKTTNMFSFVHRVLMDLNQQMVCTYDVLLKVSPLQYDKVPFKYITFCECSIFLNFYVTSLKCICNAFFYSNDNISMCSFVHHFLWYFTFK